MDALRESEDRFRILAECVPVVVWMTDSDNRCTYISRHWREFTGRDPEKDLGFEWVEALHPDDRERAARDLIEASASRQPCKGEYRVRRADGDYGWLHDYGVPRFHRDGSYAGHIGTCVDITHHKELERTSVEVKDNLVLGQEVERKRVAQELHDDIGQGLALVGLQLTDVEQLSLTASPLLKNRLKALRERVESIALDVHRISRNLYPPALVHLGLIAALRGLCREFSEQAHIAVDFTGDDASPPTSPEVGLALYRVTQECLTNIAKHSGSRKARVTVTERSGALELSIADDGVGFDDKRLPGTSGLGLVNIRDALA